MTAPEDALVQAKRHVREGEARITRQVALIEELDRTGHEHAADTARELLETFRNVLQTWRGHLAHRAPPPQGGNRPELTNGPFL